MHSKPQLIESIVEINPSADRTWLALFDSAELKLYADHLQYAMAPRSSESFWQRPSETPAILARTAA